MWPLAYNVLLIFAAVFAIPYYGVKMLLTGKYRRSLGPKLGLTPLESVSSLAGSPRIWVHAVSVGEVTAAAPIIRELYSLLPEARIVLSTSTETGRQMAEKMSTGALLIYYPLDIKCVVKKIVEQVRPDVFVPVETEVWPNFIRLCQKRGTRIVMVNGRISPRSFARYKSTGFFWKGVFGGLDEAGMISAVDGERIESLGVSRAHVKIIGNAKYDGFAASASPELQKETAVRLGVAPGEATLVAGSTHEGEESVVIDVYRRLLERFPALGLIIVPRHIERAEAVAELMRRDGFANFIRMSQLNAGKKREGERIVLVDVIGELFKLYSLATVVFCGGSLVKKGGQNLLEAAAWGKVVFHGPYMDDFREETLLLGEVGAGITISNGEELRAGVSALLDNPALLHEKGEAGRRAIASARGASARYAELVRGALRP
jgi:3-deoxy-D-manno-octulosonic-acid transferase